MEKPKILNNEIMKILQPTISPDYYPSTRKGQFTQFMRMFTAERKETLELLSGQLVKFDYQLALTFETKSTTHVLDTSTITKSYLKNGTLKSYGVNYVNFLKNFFYHGVMNEGWFELANSIADGDSLVKLWVDATPMTCEYGSEPTELQSSYRVSAPVAEFHFDHDFQIWLADRVISFYRNDTETDMNIRWEEKKRWIEFKEGVERTKEWRLKFA